MQTLSFVEEVEINFLRGAPSSGTAVVGEGCTFFLSMCFSNKMCTSPIDCSVVALTASTSLMESTVV
jgi:hypothetical protein